MATEQEKKSEEELARLREEVQQLKVTISAQADQHCKASNQAAEKHAKELESLQAENQLLREENQHLRCRLKSNTELLEGNTEIQAQIQELNVEPLSLSTHNERCQAQIQNDTVGRKVVKDNESAVTEAQARFSGTKAGLEATQIQLAEAKQKFQELSAKREQLREKLKALQEDKERQHQEKVAKDAEWMKEAEDFRDILTRQANVKQAVGLLIAYRKECDQDDKDPHCQHVTELGEFDGDIRQAALDRLIVLLERVREKGRLAKEEARRRIAARPRNQGPSEIMTID